MTTTAYTVEGERALRYWHDASNFGWTFDFTLQKIRAINPTTPDFLGKAIMQSGLSGSAVRHAMESFARQTAGGFPKTYAEVNAFFDALEGEVTGFRGWQKIITETAVETGTAIKNVATTALSGTLLIGVVALLVFVVLKAKK